MQNPGTEFVKSKANTDTSAQAPALSDYMDYRKYLADWYAYRRARSRGELRPYSYPMFSAAADIKSPNYLKMIMEGRRNLSEDMVGKFAKAIGLLKEQAEELRLLVMMNQASDPAERNYFLKELADHRVNAKIRSGEIDRKSFDKIPNWVAWILYAMVDQEGLKFDSSSLRSALRGKATENEIDEALRGLLASGELVRDESGVLRKARPLMEDAENIPVALVRKLQAQLMMLGLESLYQDAPTDREFGTLTLSLTKAEFEELKFTLRQLRKKINKDNAIARDHKKGERVYQLNIQLFPVTNTTASMNQSKEEGLSALLPTANHLAELLKKTANQSVEKDAKAVENLLKDARLAAEIFVDASKN